MTVHRPARLRPLRGHVVRGHAVRGRAVRGHVVPVLAVPALALSGLALTGSGAPAAAAAPARASADATPRAVPWDFPSAGYRKRTFQLPANASLEERTAVDVLGRVVGSFHDYKVGVYRAALWDAAGGVTVLPDLGYGGTAEHLSGGRVVGSVLDAAGASHAALWTDGVLRVIDVPGAVATWGVRVNRSGQVGGLAENAAGGHSVFVWGPSTGVRLLPFTPDDSWPRPTLDDLDDSGTAIGALSWPPGSAPVEGALTAYRWTSSGGPVDLLARERATAPLLGVRDLHLSAGGVITVQGTRRAGDGWESVAWAVPPGAAPVPLGVSRAAVDVDDRGRVVASTTGAGPDCPDSHTVTWDAVHGSTPLSLGLCGELVQATNDAGEVVGVWEPSETGGYEFVWDPVRGLRQLQYGSIIDLSQGGHVLAYGFHEPKVVFDPPEGLARVVVPSVLDTTLLRGSTRFLDQQPWLAVGGDAVALLRFPVPPPAGRRLVAATVRLRATDAAGSGTATPMQARRALGGWGATTTWSERGTVVGTRRLGVLGAVGPGEVVSVRIDPGDVPAARGGTLELALTGSGSDTLRVWSREGGTAVRPLLDLVYR